MENFRFALDLPEISGKTIATFPVHDDPPTRELLIGFTDGTSVSVDIDSTISIRAKHYRLFNGNLVILHERSA